MSFSGGLLQALGELQAKVLIAVKSQRESAKEIQFWLNPVAEVVVKQISSKPRNYNSAREIKLKQEGREMIFIKSVPATLFLQANLAWNHALIAFNRCELMFYLTVHLLLALNSA